jgi:hypothetical protein
MGSIARPERLTVKGRMLNAAAYRLEQTVTCPPYAAIPSGRIALA